MLKKGEVKMIKKLLKSGLNKSKIARKLDISRDTVCRWANKPYGYVPVIAKAPIGNLVDSSLSYIADMLEIAK